ncbi:hypothetical protein [Asaia bogorensis]|uniref:hypothetical protein n=1 Tax=Asaia bogorensis TaxID=91915 RepID=UPI0021BE7F1E|nr:hypothetical protein [Asaia bogorensis]
MKRFPEGERLAVLVLCWLALDWDGKVWLMSIPDDFWHCLDALGIVCEAYRSGTGHDAVLVGGAATVIYTAGAFSSGDFDFVVINDQAFDQAMIASGFRREDRCGKLRVGYYHPDHPRYGVQAVGSALFDGRADRKRLFALQLREGPIVKLPRIEDMIADRLAQFAVASPSDDSRLRQATVLFRLAEKLDMGYLRLRCSEEGGDFTLLERL